MKLNAEGRVRYVPNPHDFIVFGPGRHLENIGERFSLDQQRMITCRDKRVLNPFEQILVLMVNLRHFAMHNLLGTGYLAAEYIADTLMAETYAENRNLSAQFTYDVV